MIQPKHVAWVFALPILIAALPLLFVMWFTLCIEADRWVGPKEFWKEIKEGDSY